MDGAASTDAESDMWCSAAIVSQSRLATQHQVWSMLFQAFDRHLCCVDADTDQAKDIAEDRQGDE